MMHEILALLWRSMLTTSIAICIVLALRLPLRRWLGAQAAYALWALVPVMAMVATLPDSTFPATVNSLAPVRVLAAQQVVGSLTPIWRADAITTIALLACWLLGAVATTAGFLLQQRRYVNSLGDLHRDADGWRSASATVGPALVGAWRPRIVLPADFHTRYTSEERALIVAHERTHLRRGDAQTHALAALLRSAHWFNPLVHFAASCLRFDQELACDALVIARFPEARRRYADAMLKTQLVGEARQQPGLPIGCHWRFDHPMKERIMMLKRPLPTQAHRIAASIGIVALIGCVSLTSWAAQNAAAPGVVRGKPGIQVGTIENAGPSEDVTYRRMYPPKYP
ncbi:MAG: M56 family metallopeptidase, partial [Rudaea sp.]